MLKKIVYEGCFGGRSVNYSMEDHSGLVRRSPLQLVYRRAVYEKRSPPSLLSQLWRAKAGRTIEISNFLQDLKQFESFDQTKLAERSGSGVRKLRKVKTTV